MAVRNFDDEVNKLLTENVPTLKGILDTLPMGVMITNREGVVIYIQPDPFGH